MENVYQQTQTPVDWLSIVESSIGFAGIVVGTTMASDAGWLSLEVGLALLVGVIGLVLYAQRQLSLANPMLNLRVFANKQFTVGTLLVMLDFGVILASMYLLPMYLQRVMGLPVAMTGLVMLPGGIVNAAVSAIAGRMYDSHGAKWLSRGGFVIAILGVLILLNSGAQSPLWWIILGHVVLMIGAPLAMSPAQTYGLNSLSGAESADGSALLNTLQQIVGAVSTAVATKYARARFGQSRWTNWPDNWFAFWLCVRLNPCHYRTHRCLPSQKTTGKSRPLISIRNRTGLH